MKTKYNLLKLKEALRELMIEVPDNVKELKDDIRFPEGYIEYESLNGETKYVPITSSSTADTAYAASFKDGSIGIVLSERELQGPDLFAILAHEVGHIEAGHPGSGRSNLLDIKQKRQQEILDNLYKLSDVDYDRAVHSYYRMNLFSLLRGGVMVLELEADLIALNYCPASLLLQCHRDKLTSTNLSVRLEISNRFNRILSEEIKNLKKLILHYYNYAAISVPDSIYKSVPYGIRFKGKLDTPDKIKKSAIELGIPNLEAIMELREFPDDATLNILENFIGVKEGTLVETQKDFIETNKK